MSEASLKLAVISALKQKPQFEGLQQLHFCNERRSRRLLRWLDESGLALYFLSCLRNSHETDRLPAFFTRGLDSRLESNRKRSAVMLCEIEKLSAIFDERGIRHAFLKGQSLVPDFCADVELRHQSDIDILLSRESIRETGVVLRRIGYLGGETLPTGEIHFSRPRYKPPSVEDDIYAPAFHVEIELHTSIWRNLSHVALSVPADCLAHTQVRLVNQVRFSSLSLEDMFIAQILHAFGHVLGSWLRLSWLYEIHSFVIRHSKDESLWISIRARASENPDLRDVFGLVLQLTKELFCSPIPEVMRDWCVDPLPGSFRQWISEFGVRWALCGLSGSKLSLLIHAEFISDPRARRLYLWRRMLPLKGRPTIGPTKLQGSGARLSGYVAQTVFAAKRAFFHAVSLGSFGVDAIRWNHMLHETRKERALSR